MTVACAWQIVCLHCSAVACTFLPPPGWPLPDPSRYRCRRCTGPLIVSRTDTDPRLLGLVTVTVEQWEPIKRGRRSRLTPEQRLERRREEVRRWRERNPGRAREIDQQAVLRRRQERLALNASTSL